VIDGAVFVGIIQVSDTAKVRSYYEDTLGLKVIAETPFALTFDAGGTTLRVTPVPNFSPPPASVASWRVPDIEAAVRELTERGVRFHDGEDKDELGIWSDPSGAGKVA
jgi:catechol 2,3-dioxygenase-like lactoylglutathione lyase family enzyme